MLKVELLYPEKNGQGDWPRIYVFKNGDLPRSSARVTYYATSNCQLCTIGGMNDILSNHMSTAKEHLKAIYPTIKQPALIVDINRVYVPRFKDLLKDGAIILEQNYKSTNGSEMTMFIIKLVRPADPSYSYIKD